MRSLIAAEIAAAVYEPGTLLSNPWADVKPGSLTRRYLYTRAVDEVFARLADDQQNGQLELSWYLTDRLGSVRQQVQTDGTILNEINYDSFGNIVTETNPSEGDRFKYTGREYDDLTGLYYYRARWYDAGTGKFLSEDPLGFAAGDYNLSRYVWNTVVNAIDPSGLEPPKKRPPGGYTDAQLYEIAKMPFWKRIQYPVTMREFKRIEALKERTGWTAYIPTSADIFGEWALFGWKDYNRDVERLRAELAPKFHPPDVYREEIYAEAWRKSFGGNVKHIVEGTFGAVELGGGILSANPFMIADGAARVVESFDYIHDGAICDQINATFGTEFKHLNPVRWMFQGGSEWLFGSPAFGDVLYGFYMPGNMATRGRIFDLVFGGKIQVTTWARAGVVPELAPGRWVQLGRPTLWNYIKTGLWGRRFYNVRFRWRWPVVRFDWTPPDTPFSNFTTEMVRWTDLGFPSSWEAIKAIFLGQRVLK